MTNGSKPRGNPVPERVFHFNLFRTHLFYLPMAGAIGVIVYGGLVHCWTFTVLELFVGAASSVLGVLIGFLFGIPRTVQAENFQGETNQASPEGKTGGKNLGYLFNTNLEQISDWLTKILVGVGLVQMGKLGEGLGSIGEAVAASMRIAGAAPCVSLTGVVPLTVTVIAFFGVTGFLGGYLWTRLEYGDLLASADTKTLRRLDEEFTEYVAEKVDEKVAEHNDIAKNAERIASAATFGRTELASGIPGSTSAARAHEFVLPENWPAAVREKVKAFIALTPVWNDDPTARLFGKVPSAANGWRLSAKVQPVAGSIHVVTLTLEADPTVRLPETVVFLLHPTFSQRIVKVPVEKSPAELSIPAGGAFTVVAIADEGRTILSYNLATAPGATPDFINA